MEVKGVIGMPLYCSLCKYISCSFANGYKFKMKALVCSMRICASRTSGIGVLQQEASGYGIPQMSAPSLVPLS